MGFLRLLHVLKSSTVTFCSVLRRTLLDIVVRKETSVTLPGRFFFLSEVILSYVVNFSFIKNQLTTELSFTQLMQNWNSALEYFFLAHTLYQKTGNCDPIFHERKEITEYRKFSCTRLWIPEDPLRAQRLGSSSFPSRIKNAGAVRQSTMCVVEREWLIVCAIFQTKRVLNIICTLRNLTVNILHSITWGYSSIGAGKPILTQIPS